MQLVNYAEIMKLLNYLKLKNGKKKNRDFKN